MLIKGTGIRAENLDARAVMPRVLRGHFLDNEFTWPQLQDALAREIRHWNSDDFGNALQQTRMLKVPKANPAGLERWNTPDSLAEFLVKKLAGAFEGDPLLALPRQPRVRRVKGPMRLLRFAGKFDVIGSNGDFLGQEPASAFGPWWWRESLLTFLQECLSGVGNTSAEPPKDEDPDPIPPRKVEITPTLIGWLRGILAVSLEWNDFSEVWLLEIPDGQEEIAIVGSVQAQPLVQNEKDPRRHTILPGGALQYYFPAGNPFNVTRYA